MKTTKTGERMSKQSEAKKRQNYQDKPLQRRCRECKNIVSEILKNSWGGELEKLSCAVGGFAVKANSICDLFKLKKG